MKETNRKREKKEREDEEYGESGLVLQPWEPFRAYTVVLEPIYSLDDKRIIYSLYTNN